MAKFINNNRIKLTGKDANDFFKVLTGQLRTEDSGVLTFKKPETVEMPARDFTLQQQIDFISEARKLLLENPKHEIRFSQANVEMLKKIEENLLAVKLYTWKEDTNG